MAIFCLITTAVSANAQTYVDIDHLGIKKTGYYDEFNDSMGLKLNDKTTLLVEHECRDIFALNMYKKEKVNFIDIFEKENFFDRIDLTKLYSGNLNGMITHFNDIIDKSKKWYKICVENNSPSLNKEINIHGDMFCYNNETHVYLVKLHKKYFNEQDLIRILEYIKNFDVSKYLEEEKNKEEEEEHRKKVLNLLN